ncbi:MAG: hypothetical protein MUF44_12550 [Hydrogenophaga sp.]|nr:hypothetical protein [Hydrogenophaga sp.]
MQFDKIQRFGARLVRSSDVSVHDAGSAQLVHMPSTDGPQEALFGCGQIVDMFHVAALQQTTAGDPRVCIPGFLPTMKPQLSQLPLIVG